MSERMPTPQNQDFPAPLQDFTEIQQNVYKNGAKHVYGANEDGKLKHLSHDDVLAAYGYEARDPQSADSVETNPVEQTAPTQESTSRAAAEADKPIVEDIYSAIAKRSRITQRSKFGSRGPQDTDNEKITKPTTHNEYGYAGPVAKGKEVILRPSTEVALRPSTEVAVRPTTTLVAPAPKQEAAQPRRSGEELISSLDNFRDQLLKIEIRREARSFEGLGKSGRADRDLYEEKMDEYKLAVGDIINRVKEDMKAAGSSEQEIASALKAFLRSEDRARTERKFVLNKEAHEASVVAAKSGSKMDRLRVKGRSFVRKWAEVPTTAKLAVSGASLIGGAFVLPALGIGVAGLAAGSAVKYSLGLLNRKASAVNVSKKSLDSELRKLERIHNKRKDETITDTDQLVNRHGARVEKTMSRRQLRNKLGNVVLIGSGLLTAYELAQLGLSARNPFGRINIPRFGVGGKNSLHAIPKVPHKLHHVKPHKPNLHLNKLELHTIHAKTPNQFVRGAFRSLKDQGLVAHGADSQSVRHIITDMESRHMRIAAGMERTRNGHLRRHLVDVARDWKDGRTENFDASAAASFRSRAQMREFVRIAQEEGVNFTRSTK